MKDLRTHLALGTVQFGLPYGVTNQKGQVSLTEVRDILTAAKGIGIRTLDTAYAYGQSEETLGHTNMLADFDIVTKLPPGTRTAQAGMQAIRESLSRLKLDKVDALLMHDFNDYYESPEMFEALEQIKYQGLCQKIGFSLYYPWELQLLLDKNVPLDIVQVPYSVVDRRFEPYFKDLTQSGIEVHVRSVFLQGAVFIKPSQLPEYLTSVTEQWQALHDLARAQELKISSLCLNFALAHPSVNKVIVGVDSLEQLISNSTDLKDYPQVEALRGDLNKVIVNEEEVLLPFLWK